MSFVDVLLNKSSTTVLKPDDAYLGNVMADLNTIYGYGDKVLSSRMNEMESSTNLHFIEMPAPGDNNVNSPTSSADDKKGIPTGSTTKYNPSAKTNARGDKRDPKVGLAHELLGHGYDSDKGKSNYNKTANGIPMYEVSGVNVENRVRARTGDPKKTTYGGKPIPANLLDDTHKKKKK